MVNHLNKRIHNQNLLLNNIFSRQHLNPESRSNVIVSIWLIFKHSTIFTSDALLICMVLLRLGEQIIKITTKSLWDWHYKSFIRFDLDYGVWRRFQQYFRYIVAVSFIGGGNWSTRWKPLTCRKSLTNFITYTSPWAAFELTTLLVIGTDCTGSCKSNYHTTTTVYILVFIIAILF
jgi:hypothetical protein